MFHRFIGRGLVNNILINMTVAVVAGSIGYKIDGYLSRDKISIERVDLTADTTKLPYPLREMMEINKALDFSITFCQEAL